MISTEISKIIDIIDKNGNERGENISYKIEKFDYLENIIERAIVGKNPDAINKLIGIVRNREKNPSSLEQYLKYDKWEYRLGFNDKLIPFLSKYNIFIEGKLSKTHFEAVLHCDAYPTNVLENGVIIDPKPLKIGNPMMDISHFLISPRLKHLDCDKFLEDYLGFLSHSNLNDYKKMKIKKTFYAHVLHNSLCLTGAMLNQTKKDSKKINDAQYFLGLAIETMDKLSLNELRQSFVQYIKYSKQEELKQAL